NALNALDKGIRYFQSLSVNGGYIDMYPADGKDNPKIKSEEKRIDVHFPGTSHTGYAFLVAYRTTGEQYYLSCAEEAADALIDGQQEAGGWYYSIYKDKKAEYNYSTFDDDVTQYSLHLLMDLGTIIKKEPLQKAVTKGYNLILKSQSGNGGWPQAYPMRGDHRDFFTFKNNALNDCINVMIDAHKIFGKQEYYDSLEKGSDFIILSQLPPPQSGWAQYYNHYLQPAWGQSFEPPSVCSSVTVRNIYSLIDLYIRYGKEKYLEPVSDALRWLKESRLPNGKWARFYELGTNKPLYYERGRKRVGSIEELPTVQRSDYEYEMAIDLEEITGRYNEIKKLGREKYLEKQNKPLSESEKLIKAGAMESNIQKIISSQDEIGRWVTGDAIETKVFISNVNALCEYINLVKSIY
ncbi:pectate lyase, partial [candidate division KSB1 bacterium]